MTGSTRSFLADRGTRARPVRARVRVAVWDGVKTCHTCFTYNMTVKQVGQVSISPGNYMYDRFMRADDRCFSVPRLQIMPVDFPPTARALLLAFWLCEATGEPATKARLLELVGGDCITFGRTWKFLHRLDLIKRV